MIHWLRKSLQFLILTDPTYFPGRCAEINALGHVIGKLGVLHPEVLNTFDLNMPAAAIEIDIEPFLWLNAIIMMYNTVCLVNVASYVDLIVILFSTTLIQHCVTF